MKNASEIIIITVLMTDDIQEGIQRVSCLQPNRRSFYSKTEHYSFSAACYILLFPLSAISFWTRRLRENRIQLLRLLSHRQAPRLRPSRIENGCLTGPVAILCSKSAASRSRSISDDDSTKLSRSTATQTWKGRRDSERAGLGRSAKRRHGSWIVQDETKW